MAIAFCEGTRPSSKIRPSINDPPPRSNVDNDQEKENGHRLTAIGIRSNLVV
jgi:hypothetical protein